MNKYILTEYKLTKNADEILSLIKIIWNDQYSKALDCEFKDNDETLGFILNVFKRLLTNQAHLIEETEDTVNIVIRFAKPKPEDDKV